ncbi:MAG: alpha/beta hydrolase [Bacteroidales bacterium]|nr:alpha/beta hydrolase [Bacteroidales bacterium]
MKITPQNKKLLLSRAFFLLFCVFCLGFTCSDTPFLTFHDAEANAFGTPVHGQRLLTGKQLDNSQLYLSLEDEADDFNDAVRLPESIRTGQYYIGQVNGNEYVMSFSSITDRTFEGQYYETSAGSIAYPQKFNGKYKKGKCILWHEGKKTVMKKLLLDTTDSTFSANYNIKKQEGALNFKRYRAPYFVTYKKRYHEEFFEYSVRKNVEYGKASGYWVSNPTSTKKYGKIIAEGLFSTLDKKELSLKMDLYFPEGDYLNARPLIMFIHGGGFYIGDKEDNPIVLWCQHYAKMGYVVASINYRMGFKPSKESIERCGYRATQDAHAAMRFLIHHKDQYHIDPNYIFVAGSSAGGITTLNLAFMRNANRPETSYGGVLLPDLGNIESSGNSLKENFNIRCICNMWGAVHDINVINNSRTSIISFHGDADKVVPYDYDVPFKDIKLGISKVFFNKMYGSAQIHKRAKALGYREELHTFPGLGHAPHTDENDKPTDKFWYIQQNMDRFFYKEFVPTELEITPVGGQQYTINATDYKQIHWRATGGVILSQNGNSVRVMWFGDASQHHLEASGYLKNGAIFYNKFTQE